MVQVLVVNQCSPYWGQRCVVALADWKEDSFWVEVGFRGEGRLMARRFLLEC